MLAIWTQEGTGVVTETTTVFRIEMNNYGNMSLKISILSLRAHRRSNFIFGGLKLFIFKNILLHCFFRQLNGHAMN